MSPIAILLALFLGQTTAPQKDDETDRANETGKETLIDLDVKGADVLDLLRLVAEVGEIHLVADPDVACEATLTLRGMPWPQVLEILLRTCRLAEERIGPSLVRVTTREQLRREYAERRKYEEEKGLSGPLRTTYRKLAYARAREIAPLLERFLSSRGSVTFDERTNTVIITDVAR